MTTFTLNDIRDTISTFNGTGYPKIEQWVQEFQDNASVLGWNDLQKFIYAKQLIKGAAQLWLRGQRSINNWELLQAGLEKEFGNKLSIAELHKKLDSTRKRGGETYIEFLYKIIEIAKPLSLDDKSIRDYFINGIQDAVSNKAILYGASTIEDLKEKIRIYEKIKKNSWKPIANNGVRRPAIRKTCERCPHLNNHSTDECKKSMICTKCNKNGDRTVECRSGNRNQNNSYNNANSNPFTNNPRNRNEPNNNNNRANNETTFRSNFCFVSQNIHIDIQVGNYKFKTLFDTDSDLTIITKSIFNNIEGTTLIPKTLDIQGLGNGKVTTLGYILENTMINCIQFNWRFHVVEDDAIYNQPLLGCDILEILDVFISKGKTTFQIKNQQNPTCENSSDDTLTIRNEFRAICQDTTIGSELELGPHPAQLTKVQTLELENLIKNYVPNKTEETSVETKIILTDEIPIHQKPRRISFLDQKIVEKQISEWLENGIIKPS